MRGDGGNDGGDFVAEQIGLVQLAPSGDDAKAERSRLVELHFYRRDLHESRERGAVVYICTGAQRQRGQRTVHRSGIEIEYLQPPRGRAGDRRLSGRRRTVNGNLQPRRLVHCASKESVNFGPGELRVDLLLQFRLQTLEGGRIAPVNILPGIDQKCIGAPVGELLGPSVGARHRAFASPIGARLGRSYAPNQILLHEAHHGVGAGRKCRSAARNLEHHAVTAVGIRIRRLRRHVDGR